MKISISKLALSTLGLCAIASMSSTAYAATPIKVQDHLTQLIPAAQNKDQKTDIYIVQFKEQPVVNFSGSNTMSATKLEDGQKINTQDYAVQNYRSFLAQNQDQALQNCGINKTNKVYEYTYSFNGMAARMTATQAALMSTEPNVLRVSLDTPLKMNTDSTREFLKLNKGRFSSWRQRYTGEDVIVGVLDSGIHPEHPSFADVPTPVRGDRGYLAPYGPAPEGWTGDTCDFGNTEFNPLDVPFTCNNKLLGARAYSTGFLRGGTPEEMLAANSSFSARDDNGHGSAAASNAIGNYGVQAIIDGEEVGTDVMSGVAPRARLAVYKVCWDGPAIDDPATPANEEDDSCFPSDSMAAIDQAVADGVDVINFSIGGPSTSFGSPSDVAFLFAANSGVHVATSAGNSGPDPDTVGTPASVPWITSVGAVNDDQNTALGLRVDAPSNLAGSFTALEGAGPVQLEDIAAVSGALAVAEPANGCDALTNPDAIAGNVALVIRGGCGFNDKYLNAEAAGAIAIVVYNDGTASDRINPLVMGGVADDRTIPGVMISFTDGAPLAAGAGIAVTLDNENQISLANRVVDFSSRGVNRGAPDIIKPDVVAPGVNILSAETNTENDDESRGKTGPNEFQFISGTSFSSPHVAGVLALIKQARPDWSPAVARSAMMTTARQNITTQFSTDPATPFDMGAGHVVPNKTYNPGLAYDANLEDYTAFTCGNNVRLFPQEVCDFLEVQGRSFDGSDLNLPSIGVGELVGQQTVTRTVTNVDKENPYRYWQRPTRYYASVDAPAGIDVEVSPRFLRLRPGQSADYTVTFTANGDADLGDFTFGSITWIEKGKRREGQKRRYYSYLETDNDDNDGYYTFGQHNNHSGHYYSWFKHILFGKHWFGGYRYHGRQRFAKEVRSPIAIRPVAISTSDEVVSTAVITETPEGNTAAGSVRFPVGFGYEGTYSAVLSGLNEAQLAGGTLTQADGLNAFCFDFTASNLDLLRIRSYDEDTGNPGNDDLDLRVFSTDDCATFANLAQLGSSGSPTSNEVVNLVDAAAGSYVVVVDFFAAAVDNAIDYTLFVTGVANDQGNTTVVAPTAATIGEPSTITVDYQGLNAGTRYLGVISHQDDLGEITRTVVDVNTQ